MQLLADQFNTLPSFLGKIYVPYTHQPLFATAYLS